MIKKQYIAQLIVQFYKNIVDYVVHFIVENYTFEVGGKNKQQKQIEKDGKSFVVKDDVEFGYLNVIPLWAFGLNY
jgi:hypothetical protein